MYADLSLERVGNPIGMCPPLLYRTLIKLECSEEGQASQPKTQVWFWSKNLRQLILPCGVTPQIHHLLFLSRQTSPGSLSELHKTNTSGRPSFPSGPIGHLPRKTMLGKSI